MTNTKTEGTVIKINRAPVLTLWALVVAERLGHPHDEALTLAKAVAGLNAQSKGRRLGIYEKAVSKEDDDDGPNKAKRKKTNTQQDAIALLGRDIQVTKTKEGVRAIIKDEPIDPASVERYLRSKFGEHYADAKEAMEALAKAHTPKQLGSKAYDLYESFRPNIPEGVKGWGAAGNLNLNKIRALAEG